MKKIVLFIICLFLFTNLLISQQLFKRNTVYFELGGNGLFSSINYEWQISKHPGFGVRLGTGIYFTKYSLTIPVGVNYLFKLNNELSYIDVGIGVTYSKADASLYAESKPRDPNYVNKHTINTIPSFGYRRQTIKNTMLRISLTPVFNQYDGLPFIGISIGKVF